jgi:hypothetical protein
MYQIGQDVSNCFYLEFYKINEVGKSSLIFEEIIVMQFLIKRSNLMTIVSCEV